VVQQVLAPEALLVVRIGRQVAALLVADHLPVQRPLGAQRQPAGAAQRQLGREPGLAAVVLGVVPIVGACVIVRAWPPAVYPEATTSPSVV
jgi:hypothetical protein